MPSLKDFSHLICHFDLSFFVLRSEKSFEKIRNLLNAQLARIDIAVEV